MSLIENENHAAVKCIKSIKAGAAMTLMRQNHGNYIGKEILFQIDHTTFICRQRTNKLTDIVSLLVEQN